MMPVRFKIAIKTAGLAGIAGTFLSTVLFCVYITINMTGARDAAAYATIPGIGIMAGILGFLTAFPTALILGTPIVWLWGRRFAASPILSSILLALIGAGLGRWMFFLFFNSGLGAFIDPARYACPIFGAVVAGLHPIIAGWLYQDKNDVPARVSPMKPIASPSLDFRYYPGNPEGYAGYTDYNAMLQTINDDLIARDTDWQFKSVGFAKGFLASLLIRTSSGHDAPGLFRLVDANGDDATALGWMALMQAEGTDNAGPSTFNFKLIIDKVSSDISTAGPYRLKYWSKARQGLHEDLEESDVSSDRLRDLINLMRGAEQRGAQMATSARIVPLDFDSGH